MPGGADAISEQGSKSNPSAPWLSYQWPTEGRADGAGVGSSFDRERAPVGEGHVRGDLSGFTTMPSGRRPTGQTNYFQSHPMAPPNAFIAIEGTQPFTPRIWDTTDDPALANCVTRWMRAKILGPHGAAGQRSIGVSIVRTKALPGAALRDTRFAKHYGNGDLRKRVLAQIDALIQGQPNTPLF